MTLLPMMPRCKVSLRTMFSLVILLGAAVVLFCGWFVQFNPCSSASSNGKVHILLLASWRSGSGFLGRMFSQHPSVFYLLEPIWHMWFKLEKPKKREMRMAMRDLLRSVFQCDFSVMDSYFKNNNTKIFKWDQSRALCSPPACSVTPRNQLADMDLCHKMCQPPSMQVVEEICHTYSHVVIKVVRVFDLESLYPLLQDPRLDFRIIHLVRDPRAVFRSREVAGSAFVQENRIVLDQKPVPSAELPYEAMREICRGHVRINERGVLEPPPFLKGRYKMVRYEDIARNTLEEISALYKFAGLEMTSQLEEWIYKFSHSTGTGKGRSFYVSSRNATKVSVAWRTLLPHSKVKHVQKVCEEAMSLIGYRSVNSEEEQKTLHIDLLVPQNQIKHQVTKKPP